MEETKEQIDGRCSEWIARTQTADRLYHAKLQTVLKLVIGSLVVVLAAYTLLR